MTGSALSPPATAAPHSRPPAHADAAVRPEARAARRSGLLAALLGCVALAALTLLAPSQPTYDPWAWIVWGREVAHLDLSTTYGPSWKPLPVMFTTVFSLFGSAAPALWVLAARAGALLGVLAAFRVGRRLGGTAAGVAAGAALLVAPWYLRNAALANSEGLQVALALLAVDRHLAGRRRAAFGFAVGLGLLRPEAWPFLGLFGLWLVWRARGRPGVRRDAGLVGLGLAALPLLWLAPEQWGSDDLLRAAHRAQQPVSSSPAFSDHPLVSVLDEGVHMLTWPTWAGLALAAGLLVWRRDRALAVLAAGAGAWTLLVAAMTANGYSGNQRYLMVPAAVLIVVAAAAAGRALAPVAAGRRAAAGALVVAALGALFAAPSLGRVDDALRATTYQARLLGALGPLVDRAGGAERLKACGAPFTGPYLVPAVAWQLGVHTSAVALDPHRPAVIFRVHTTSHAAAVPSLRRVDDGPLRTLATAADWRIVAACGRAGR